MPPKRREKAAADILDKVLDTASLPHSINVDNLKQQIEEQLRVLNVRARLKQFGKGDSIESRKLVLLQHILKASVVLETKTLASAVGIKAAAFETLCNKASHYIDVSSVNSKKRKSRSLSQTTTSTDSTTVVQSTIPALSIRLGAQVHDSHGYARRAQQLFSDLERYLTSTTTISAQNKRGYLLDMQRTRATYEAACFYVTARGTRMKKSRANSSDSVEQEQEDTQLSIQDIIHASTSVSALDFKTILTTVQELVMEMEKEQKKVAASTKKSAAATTKRKRERPSTKSARQEESSSLGGAAQALLESVESAATGGKQTRQRTSLVMDATPKFVYSPRFLQWKEEVLKETCDKEMKLASEDGDVASITDSQAIQRAADAILRRNSLLQAVPE